jgi:hypothetical protein
MAAPDFSQQINPTNFQAYVQQGVVDKSGAYKAQASGQALTSLLGTGIEMAKEYDKQSTLQGLTDQVAAIEQERQQRSLAGQQALEQETQMLTQESLAVKQAAGYDETYPIMLDTKLNQQVQSINNQLSQKTEQLAKARDQKVMTEFELKTRLNKIAMEAIQNNPAYAREIMSHVATVAELNNITLNVKREEAMIDEMNKSKAAQDKDIMDELEKLNIPERAFTDGRGNLLDPESAMQAIDAKRAIISRAEQMDRATTMNIKTAQLKSQQFFGTGLDVEFSAGTLAFADNEFQKIVNDTTMSGPDKVKMIERRSNQLSLNLTKSFPLMGLSTSTPEVKDLVTLLRKQVDDLKGLYSREATGELDLADKKIKLEIAQTVSQLGVYDRIPNLATYEFMTKFAESLGTRAGMTLTNELNQSIAKNLTENPLNIGTKYEKGKAVYTEKLPDGKILASHGLSVSIDKAVSLEATPDDINLLETQLTNYNTKLNSNPANATELIRDLNSVLSTPNFKGVVDKIKDTTILGNLQESILASTTLLETQVANTLPENAKISLRPDGRLTVVGGDMRTQSQLVRSINEAFLAFHHVSGLSLNDAINQFYGQIPALGVVEPTEKK